MHTPPEENHSTVLPHSTVIRSRLPAWLTNASVKQRTDLRSALLDSNASRILVANILSQLQSIEIFAEPLLELEMKSRAPELIDMQAATLVKHWKKDSFLGIPIYDTSPEHSLLEAALFNFEEWETQSSAFGSGSVIYREGKAAGLESSLKPEVFARHCRDLDLGLQYHHHLKQILDLDRPADELMLFAHKREHFVRYEQSRFKVVLQMAFMQGAITPQCRNRLRYFLLPLRKRLGKLPLFHQVHFLGVALPGVIHFAADPDDGMGPCAVYLPGHPESPLKEYPSLVEFQSDCLEHLKSKDYRRFVSQLLPVDYQGRLLTEKLRKAYSDLPPDQPANLTHLARIEGDLFEDIHWQRLQRLEEDVGKLATPTAQANAIKREALLDDYHTAGLDLLFALTDLIPRLRQTLLTPPGSQLAATAYQDFLIWSPLEVNAGLIHLLNVAEATANGETTQEICGLPKLIPVRFQGHTRLWKPDLTPYQSALKPPDEHWQPNALGLYPWARATLLKLDGEYYTVEKDEDSDRWRIVLAGYPDIYSPPLRHNCVGAWRTIHEQVWQWSQQQLLARLGPRAARLPEALADAALTFSGTSLYTLRQIHHFSRRTPPLLLDSLKRLWILGEIDSFDLDRAQGKIVSELSPRIQAYLLSVLPGWPKDTALKILRGDSQVALQYGEGLNAVSITERHWLAGKLLDSVLRGLDPREIDTLLEVNISQLDQPNQLALTLVAQAKLKRLALLEHLYTGTEHPDTPAQRKLRQGNAELPKSHLADAIAALAIQEQSAPETTPTLKREIGRALEQVRISRVFEGLYPDWPHAQQSDRLAFSLLETLEAWPRQIRLELWDPDIETAAPVEALGEQGSPIYRRLTKTGTDYRLQDQQGSTLSGPHDLYTGVWLALPKLTQQALHGAHGISLDEKRAATNLKQAVFAQASTLRRQIPAIRAALHPPANPRSASTVRLPEHFAVAGTSVSGLQLREGGIYWNLNRKPIAAHAHWHFIHEGDHYYPVRKTPEGWRLLNARNPYGFYQPLLQQEADGTWRLHETSGLAQTATLAVPTPGDAIPTSPMARDANRLSHPASKRVCNT